MIEKFYINDVDTYSMQEVAAPVKEDIYLKTGYNISLKPKMNKAFK